MMMNSTSRRRQSVTMSFVSTGGTLGSLRTFGCRRICSERREQLRTLASRRCVSSGTNLAMMSEAMRTELYSKKSNIEWLLEPVTLSGKVERGFGRGSRDLGTPTANLPASLLDGVVATERNGVYLGFGVVPGVSKAPSKMVASIGYNPTYQEEIERVMEAFLMDGDLPEDFYGREMRLCIVGYMRPELKFNNLDALVANIKNDVAVASDALDSPSVAHVREHRFLS